MKNIADMSRDEMEMEIDSLDVHFARCEEIGQGISTKEGVRYRALKRAIEDQTGLPEVCYVKSPAGEVVIVKRGQHGCYPLDFMVSASIADEFVAKSNEHLGVSPAQREAMLFGSMFGFDLPGADPAVYGTADATA